MISKSFRDNKNYLINNEKRFRKRVPHFQDIYYPMVNGKSFIEEINECSGPIIVTFDINEYGVGLRSRIKLEVGDFLNLPLKFENSPTFECMCIVRWAALDDISYVAGCEFCNIRNNDRMYIRDYMAYMLDKI
jgi:PilZ domain.